MFEYEMVKEVNGVTGKVRWSVYRKQPWWDEFGVYRWRWLAERRLKRLQADEAWGTSE